MLSNTALAVASRSFLPVLASSAAFAALLKRASARSRSSFVMSGRLLLVGFSFGLGRLVPVGGFLGEPDRAQVSRPLPNRDIGGGDIGHRLHRLGVLRELSIEPDLLHLGGCFRFIVHKTPQIRLPEWWRAWSYVTNTIFWRKSGSLRVPLRRLSGQNIAPYLS